MGEYTDYLKDMYLEYKDIAVLEKLQETPKISVIIPCYNSEKYLEKCLASLIRQTLKNFEVICIDDGSEDFTSWIINGFSYADKRFKSIKQDNSGPSKARNEGLNMARGEYITFVDSDDWVEESYLELLYNACIESNTNMAAASMVRDKRFKVKNHLKLQDKKVFNSPSEIVQATDNHFETAGKLYKRECIKDLRFTEGVLYEDGGFTIRAIDKCASAVTVPEAVYHYVSNPKSTIKQKLNIKNENDKIETSLDLVDYAQKHNIKIKEWCIYKENHILWKIKHYIDHKDYYICGIKVCSKPEPYSRERVFLVFNTACFGDVLLCNSLCQNIKAAFPDSKTVFVTDKNWYDIAKYQKDVDEVGIYDKKGAHKGFFGMLKFIRNFQYKKPFASLITYKNERNCVIAKLLKSRFVLMQNSVDKEVYVPYRHANLLQSLTHKKIKHFPIRCNIPDDIENPLKGEKYIVLCCVTKNPAKDMPIKTALKLINKINSETNYKVVLTGAGELSVNYAKELELLGANFINLVNKTSLLELGAVLKGSVGLISCDTGTMHFGCALNVPTVCVFYEKNKVDIWAPKKELYNAVVISENQTAEYIYDTFNKEVFVCI